MLLLLQEAVDTMDSYVSLPARRLTYLVRKYVHHRHMREVEGASRRRHFVLRSAADLCTSWKNFQYSENKFPYSAIRKLRSIRKYYN